MPAPPAAPIAPQSTAAAGGAAGRAAPGWMLWGAAALAGVALGISVYLAWLSMTATAPAGCGPGSDCEQVLASRWSKWWGVPVAALAAGDFAGVVAAAMTVLWTTVPARRRWASAALAGLALAAGAAAVWFVWIQFAKVGRLCPWCLAVHACGLGVAGLGLSAGWMEARRRRRQWMPLAGAALASIAAVVAMAAGQILQPAPAPPPPDAPRMYRTRIGGGWTELNLADLPLLGPRAAPHSVLLIADYTCRHCRALHLALDQAMPRFDGKVSIAVVVIPLNPQCNPMIRRAHPDHRNACELAKLALAVFRAKPDAYPDMDAWLFSGDEPPTPAAAREKAAALVGAAALAQAEADPWVEQRLASNIELYRLANAGTVPKLIFQDRAVVNLPQAPDALHDFIAAELGINREPIKSTEGG